MLMPPPGDARTGQQLLQGEASPAVIFTETFVLVSLQHSLELKRQYMPSACNTRHTAVNGALITLCRSQHVIFTDLKCFKVSLRSFTSFDFFLYIRRIFFFICFDVIVFGHKISRLFFF